MLLSVTTTFISIIILLLLSAIVKQSYATNGVSSARVRPHSIAMSRSSGFSRSTHHNGGTTAHYLQGLVGYPSAKLAYATGKQRDYVACCLH